MTTRWSNDREPFQEHNEDMREFHKSHAQIALVNAPRYGESATLAKTRPLDLSEIIIEAGGTRLSDSPMDWSVLVPVLKVAPYKLSPN